MPTPFSSAEAFDLGRTLLDLSSLFQGIHNAPIHSANLRRQGIKVLQLGIHLKELSLRERRAERTRREESSEGKPTTVAAAGMLIAQHRFVRGVAAHPGSSLSALVVADYSSIANGGQPSRTLPPLKSRKNGRPKAPPDRLLVQQYASAAVTILIDDGMSEAQAVDFVRELLRHHLNWQGTAAAVKGWRASISALLGKKGRVQTESGRFRAGCEAYGRTTEDWERWKGNRDARAYLRAIFEALASRLGPMP